MDLSGLKVLVTGGGGSGVGKGVSNVLDAHGATVIINEVSWEKAEKAANQLNSAIPIQADISDKAQVIAMFDTIKKEVGVINGLVNNAGIGLSKELHKIKEAEYDKVFGVNVKGMWLVTSSFVDQLLPSGQKGSIVNVSSVHSQASQPKYSTYASTKAAVEGFTRATAYELGKHGIRCNAIAPGLVHSDQNRELISTWAEDPEKWLEDFIKYQQVLEQNIEPEDCGQAAAFFLSDMSRSITGQTLFVDAGKSIMLFNRDYVDQSAL